MDNKEKRRIFKINYIHYFEPIRYIITYNELQFYKQFAELAERLGMILLTKVSIHNLVGLKSDTFYKTIGLRQLRSWIYWFYICR